MCLTVRNVPANKQIIICKKSLHYTGSVYVTPFYGKEIPKNGWLFPHRMAATDLIDGAKVRGGYIHAYTDKKIEYPWSSYYRAYAFGVSAYNESMTELVCRALYIPDMDRRQSDTERIILGFSRYNKTELLKKLPILKRIEKYL
jgi:hypothetical protein